MPQLTLRQWRLAREKSQEDMAAICNVHRNTYAAWEDKPDKIPVGMAKVIADALQVSVNDIFFTH